MHIVVDNEYVLQQSTCHRHKWVDETFLCMPKTRTEKFFNNFQLTSNQILNSDSMNVSRVSTTKDTAEKVHIKVHSLLLRIGY